MAETRDQVYLGAYLTDDQLDGMTRDIATALYAILSKTRRCVKINLGDKTTFRTADHLIPDFYLRNTCVPDHCCGSFVHIRANQC
jgi:hypothetical protein